MMMSVWVVLGCVMKDDEALDLVAKQEMTAAVDKVVNCWNDDADPRRC
jgi:hypothetical protein